jgi:hypothetical protein
MRAKVRVTSPERRLTYVLDTLEQELIEATDEEIQEAAKELGMNLQMKGSAAFIGLTSPVLPNAAEFFDILAELPPDHPLRARLPGRRRGRQDS